jgi:hypothetical protein
MLDQMSKLPEQQAHSGRKETLLRWHRESNHHYPLEAGEALVAASSEAVFLSSISIPSLKHLKQLTCTYLAR